MCIRDSNVRFLQSLWDIFRESDDPDSVRAAGAVLGTTRTGQHYMTKMEAGG